MNNPTPPTPLKLPELDFSDVQLTAEQQGRLKGFTLELRLIEFKYGVTLMSPTGVFSTIPTELYEAKIQAFKAAESILADQKSKAVTEPTKNEDSATTPMP